MRAHARVAISLLAFGCGGGNEISPPRAVEITSTDYAFQAPDSLNSGRTTFTFANNGKVRHELNISRLKHGVTIDQLLGAIRAGETVQPLIEGPVGVLFASPGSRSTSGLTVDLRPGEAYAVICIFTDSAGAKRHYDLGMYRVMTVGNSQPGAARAEVPTDTIIATDYAFQYPRTLPPGRRQFEMRNEGKVRHQLDFALLKKGISFQHLTEVEREGGNVEALFEGDFGLLQATGGRTPLGMLSIDLLPGREYVIACFSRDSDKSPEHYELGMFGSIKISPAPPT